MERSASPNLDTTKLLLYYLYTFYMIINITKKKEYIIKINYIIYTYVVKILLLLEEHIS